MIGDFLTPDEAAAHLGITKRTLYNLVSNGDAGFPSATYAGRTPLWLPEQLDAWRANHPARAKTKTG